jgi:hypothetical protein|tara:strand:+ start:30379 stop:30762 length:384 start_codon:yes stop_codon:yes gene_type:complete
MKSEDDLKKISKDWFEDKVKSTNGSILSELNQIRYDALDSIGKKNNSYFHKLLLPIAGASFILFLSMRIDQLGLEPQDNLAFDAPASDIEILLGDESFDMIDQLDFYSWLEEQNESFLHDNSFEEVG